MYSVPGVDDGLREVGLDGLDFWYAPQAKSLVCREGDTYFCITPHEDDSLDLTVSKFGESRFREVVGMPSLDILRLCNNCIRFVPGVGRVVFDRRSLRALVEKIEEYCWD